MQSLELTLWIDGQLKDTLTYGAGTTLSDGGIRPTEFGKLHGDVSLDDYKVWNEALSDTDMYNDYVFTAHGPGDVNGDGFVGGADITQVIYNEGMASPNWNDGDVWDTAGAQSGSDGVIDVDDYNAVDALLGTSYGAPPEPGTIPEPATLTLLLLGGLTLLRRKRST